MTTFAIRWWALVPVMLPTIAMAAVESSGAFKLGLWFGRALVIILVILVVRWIIAKARK